MHARVPTICPQCCDAFLRTVILEPCGGVAVCWCPHERSFAVCELVDGVVTRWSLEGPLDPDVIPDLVDAINADSSPGVECH